MKLEVTYTNHSLLDIRFYAKSKKALKMRNWGLMDVTLADTGLDFKIKLETADASDNAHFFKVTDVDVKISNFKLAFRQQHHPVLTGLAAMFAKGPLLQAPIKKVLEMQIKKAVSDLDAFCYGIHSDVKKAQAQAKNDPENATNIFKSYFDAYKTKMLRQKEDKERKAEKAKQIAKEKQVETNIAFTRDQRISKNWNGGKGIPIDEQELDPKSGSGRFTVKAQEYKDLAYSGQKWESPVFSLGSAAESRDLPKVPQVTRKHHETAPSEVRGPQNTGTTSNTGNTFSSGNTSTGNTFSSNTNTSSGTGAPGSSSTAAFYGTQSSAPTDSSYANGSSLKSGANGLNTNTTGTTLGTNNPVLTGKF